MRFRIAPLVVLLVGSSAVLLGDVRPTTSLRFEITMAEGLVGGPQDGRLLLVLGRKKRPEPRQTIGQTGLKTPSLLGRDVRGFAPGITAAMDQRTIRFPLQHLVELPKGDYFAQAVLVTNRDLQLADAPGNLYSEPLAVKLDPERGGTVKIVLTRKVPPEELPPEDEYVQ